jgi:hypothetical protein
MACLSDIVHRLGGDLQAGGTRALVSKPGHSKFHSLLQAGDRAVDDSSAGSPDDTVPVGACDWNDVPVWRKELF